MIAGNGSRRPLSDINVTPLVDVMLVLLIIFMVTAPMMQQGIPVNLPKAKARGLDTPEGKIVITITKNKEVFINRNLFPLKDIQEKLRAIYRFRDNKDIFLKADAGVPYGLVIAVMSEIKGAGIDQIGMVTAPPTESAGPVGPAGEDR